jgi:hypothetical protein
MKFRVYLILGLISFFSIFTYTNCSKQSDQSSSSPEARVTDQGAIASQTVIDFQIMESASKEGGIAAVAMSRNSSNPDILRSQLLVEVVDQSGNQYLANFGKGEVSANLSVSIPNDNNAESGKIVTLEIVPKSTAYVIGNRHNHKIKIAQSYAPSLINLSRVSMSLNEGQKMDFSIQRSGGDSSQPLEVRLAGQDSMFPLEDLSKHFSFSGAQSYAPGGLKFTIPANQSELIVTVTCLDDALTEVESQISFQILSTVDQTLGHVSKLKLIENASDSACSKRADPGEYCKTKTSTTENPLKCPAGNSCAGGAADPADCGGSKFALAGSAVCSACGNQPLDMTFVGSIQYKPSNKTAACDYAVTCKKSGIVSANSKVCTKGPCQTRAAAGSYCKVDPLSVKENPIDCPAGHKCAGAKAKPVACGDNKFSIPGSSTCSACKNEPVMTFVKSINYAANNTSAVCGYTVTCKSTGKKPAGSTTTCIKK